MLCLGCYLYFYLKTLDLNYRNGNRTVGPSLAVSLECLAHCWDVASSSILYSYYFGRCKSVLDELPPIPHSCDSSICYSNRLYNFLSAFLDVISKPMFFLAQINSRIFSYVLVRINSFLSALSTKFVCVCKSFN